jgi:putative transposase
MPGAVTVRDIATAVKRPVRSIQRRASRESWSFTERSGPGGRSRVYRIEELPEDVRLAMTIKEATPKPGPKPDAEMRPEVLNQAALRAELVREFMASTSNRKGRSKGSAVKGFVDAYNTGRLRPDLFKALGRTSVRTLQRWTKQLRDNEYEQTALVDSRGGQNRGQHKVTQEEQDAILGLLLDQKRISIGSAIKLTKYILEYHGVPSPSSPATLRRFVTRWKSENLDHWTLAREGEKALLDKILPYIQRDPTLLDVGDVLVADGHRCNFRVINPWTGKPVRPALILWLDWASRDVAGYQFCLEEDVYSIHAALRAAILRLGKIPRAAYLDNGKAFKAKVFTGPLKDIDFEQAGIWGLYRHLGIHTTFANPYNARAKVVERFFGTVGHTFERMLPSFTGSSIQDKPARMRRNEKFMQELSPERVLSIEEAYRLFDSWLEFYRGQPHMGIGRRMPGEVFEAGRGPGVEPSGLNYLMQFREVKTIHRNGIRWMGRNYYHETFYGYRGKVLVRYDLGDLTRLFVYDRHGEFMCEAERLEPVHPLHALAGGPDADTYPEFKHQLTRQKSLAKNTKKVVALAARSGRTKSLEELPWTQINAAAPGLVDQVERIVGEAEPHIPDPPLEASPGHKTIGISDPTTWINDLTPEELDEEFNRIMGRRDE